MTDNILKTKPLYLYVVVIWLAAVFVLAIIIIGASIDSARKVFQERTDSLLQVINNQVNTNETILDGFAATIDAMGQLNRVKIHDYTRRIRARYPDIFMFEIAEKVRRQDKLRFETDMRHHVFAGFSIRRFTYGTGRKWVPVRGQPFYLPIIFMDPFPPASRQVLGLDLESTKFFVDSLKRSAKRHQQMATRPFILVEGQRAYVIDRPIGNRLHTKLKNLIANKYVMLVVLAKSLFENNLNLLQGLGVTLSHSGYTGKDSILYQQQLPPYSKLQTMLFPKLTATLPLHSKTQPFVLHVEEQLDWRVLYWRMLMILLAVAAVTYYVVIRYGRAYHLAQMDRVEETNRLSFLANHDTLTGLANRSLMMDRLEHALQQAMRLNSSLAVLFLDLDDFKQINDQYGHEVGDRVLKYVSDRLRKCVRSCDTLARRSGDEFVVILENIASLKTAEQVVSKMYNSFEQQIDIDGILIDIHISIGLAMYPRDGQDATKLLDLADKRMYQKK